MAADPMDVDDDDDFGDDDGFDDDGDWGDDDDAFVDETAAPRIDHSDVPAKMKEKEAPAEWKCLECEHVNKGRGLLCLNCNKPNLGELERQRKEWEEREVDFWADVFSESCLPLTYWRTNKVPLTLDVGRALLGRIFEHMLIDNKVPVVPHMAAPSKDKAGTPTCQICYCEFLAADDEKSQGGESAAVELPCHTMSCRGCMKNYVASRLMQEDIIPFIPCPAEDCDIPIPSEQFRDQCGLDVETMFEFVVVYTRKMLARNDNWIFCPTKDCDYGFLVKGPDAEFELECDACGQTHKLKKKTQMDEGFQQMVKEGKIRMCPKCSHPHMKDKGICNVMQCPKCNIWWNWQTRETASRMRELKQRARQAKTLWQPGELEYQMNLEKQDPDAFKALLERNGIKYDPNYQRGRG